MDEVTMLRRRLARLMSARDQAERIAEERTRELYDLNQHLQSQVERRTAELALARDDALAASRAKTRFLATMSHELRTPLNTIVGMTELMLENAASAEQRNMHRRVLASAESLLVLLEDALDVSRIESGDLRVAPEPVVMHDWLDELADAFILQAEGKGIAVVTDAHASLRGTASFDPDRARQVIANLLANAIKFTNAGEVVISARVNESEGKAALVIEVRDTGPGIPESSRERIFELFYREDPAGRVTPGTGLGLHIARSVSDRLGGALALESTVGVGTTFRFSLPIDSYLPDMSQPLAGMRVALIEPHGTRRRTITARLRALGAEVDAAASGARFDEDTPYQVLLRAASTLPKGGQRTRVTASYLAPKWACLAPRSAHDVGAHERAGAMATIHHPVATERLVHVLRSATGRLDTDTLTSMAPVGGGLIGPRVLVVEDHPDNRALFRRMLRRLGCQVDVAAHGEVALERLRRLEYDLVLSDIQMPRMDGFAFVRRLRALESANGTERVPVVAVTAHAVEGFAARSRAAGFDAFETKPIRANTLERVLAKFVDPRPVVLVAEDDDDSRRLITLYLESEGRFRVVPCPDGRDALEALRRRRISLVVLDIEMPGIDGLVTARAIRGNSNTATLPIVGLTGHDDPDTHARMRAAGMDDVLVKPVSRAALLGALHSRLHMPPAAPEPPPEEPAAATRPEVDSDIADLVPTFLANRRADAARIPTLANDAGWDEARRLGHGMKGAGGAYGFPRISELGASIERAAVGRDGAALARYAADLAAYLATIDM